jgi:hypothetical protein
LDAAIAGGVAIDFGEPVTAVGSGDATSTARVAVPETAGDEDGFLAAGENEVGDAGKGRVVLPWSKAERTDEAVDDELGGGVAGFDGGRAF